MKKSHIFSLLVILFTFQSFIVNAQLNGNYTINSNATTSGNNFQTFADFNNTLSTIGVSDTVFVHVIAGSGPYIEKVIFSSYAGMSANKPIYIDGNKEEVQYNSPSSDRRIIGFDGAENITIKNLNIKSLSSNYGYGIHFKNNSRNIVIDSCFINLSSVTVNGTNNSYGILSSNSNQSGSVYGNNANSITIKNSIIDGGASSKMYCGIRFTGLSESNYNTNINISNNIIKNAYINALQFRYISNSNIEYNDINRLEKTNAIFFTGISLDDGIGNTINSNAIHGTHNSSTSLSGSCDGIYISSCNGTAAEPNLIYNNLIYDFNGDGTIYAIRNERSSHTKILHNTISIENKLSTTNSDVYGIRTYISGNTEILNNIIHINKSSNGDRHGIVIPSSSGSVYSDYNIIHITGDGYIRIGTYTSSTYRTLSSWQSAQGGIFDQNSYEFDPKLVSINDLTPLDTTPNGTGLFKGIVTDYFGNPRGMNPDMGAIEFNPKTCFIPENLSTLQLNSTTNKLSWEEKFTAKKWEIEFGLHGFTLGSGTSIIATDSSTYILNNLIEGMFYDFYVRSICSIGDTTSWSIKKHFYNGTIPLAGNYTINKNEDTLSRNFVSFNQFTLALELVGLSAAVNTEVTPGSGPYNENLLLHHYSGISSTNTITINGNDEELQFAPHLLDKRVVGIDSARFIKIKNLKIKVLSNIYGYGIHFYDYCNDIVIDSCSIDLSTIENSSLESASGIVQSNSFYSTLNGYRYIENITISNSKLDGGQNQGLYYGITLKGQYGSLSDSNIFIFNNHVSKFNNVGIRTSNVKYSTIENNLVSNDNLFNSIGASGILISGNSESLTLEFNRIKNLSGITHNYSGTYSGIYCQSPDATAANPILISNNIIHDDNVNSLFYGINVSSVMHGKFYHNTIYLNCDTINANMRGFNHYGSATVYPGVEIKNNLIQLIGGTGSFGSSHVGIRLNDIVVCDYNNIDISNSIANPRGFGAFGSSNYYSTLSRWQNAQSSSFGANSSDFVPGFNDIEDFTPTSVQLNNRGDNLSIPTDFYGYSRSVNNPDIGAVEYEPCLIPSSINLTALNSDSIQMSWTNTNATSTWEIEYGLSGFLRGLGLNFITTSNSVIIDSLLPNTSYDFYIRSNCDTNVVSVFSSVNTVSTLCKTTSDSIFITNCDSYTWQQNNTTYINSGIYSDTLINSFGCDSILFLDLALKSKSITVDTQSACNSYFWNQTGLTYYNTGNYYDTLINQVGCDSIITLDLTINNPTYSAFSIAACDSFLWNHNSILYKSSGVYLDTITNSNGCDSILSLNLTINQSKNRSFSVSACNSYISPSGKYTWTTNGTYSDTISTISNCDSILTINLQILNSTYNTLNVSVCDTFVAPSGKKFFSSNTYNDTILNAVGCDSILSINLTLLKSDTTISPIACNSFNSPSGKYAYVNSGTYLDTLSNRFNCDSILTINLTILQSDTSLFPIVCEQYIAPSGKIYTNSGLYLDTILNTALCDSIITLNLTVNKATSATVNDTNCLSYTSPSGKYTYTSTGTYLDTIVNSVGCDSLLTLHVVITQNTTSTLNLSACDSLISPSGKIIYSGGLYNDTIPNVMGCDSLITFFLTVNQSYHRTDTVIACNDFQLPDNRIITASGTYNSLLSKTNGCDSSITTVLTINTIDTSVTRIGNTLISNQNNVVYQWLDCNANFNAILNDTNQSFTALQNGSYAVEVTSTCSDTSACYTIMSVGIEQIESENNIHIYPNPFTEFIYISNPRKESLVIEVVDLNGKLVQTLEKSTDLIKVEIDGAKGIYFINLKGNNSTEVYKLIKH